MPKSYYNKILNFIRFNFLPLTFIVAYYASFIPLFESFGTDSMPVTLLFTAYFTWFYGRTAGLASIAVFVSAHALLLYAAGKPSLQSFFAENPMLYFGLATDVFMVFMVHYFKFIHDQLNETKSKLEIANARAEEADKLKNAFMADLSHEIRNPLCSIIGYADLIKDDEQFTERQREFLEPIIANSNHLLTLINKVLDFSKIENEILVIENSEFDLGGLIAEVAGSYRFLAERKGIYFDYKIDENFSNMFISDQLRLKQILINLVSNAIKFTEKGGVSLDCSERSKSESYSVVLFKVSDTGPGLNPEEMSRLFKPYKQASSITERNYGGTGLGLVIADRLVRLLGGSAIKVESGRGPGGVSMQTSFSFELKLKTSRLPVKKVSDDEAPKTVQVYAAQKNDKNLKILVVEDNLFNLTLLKAILEARSYEIIDAVDGRVGLDLAYSRNPDIILLDTQLPEISGIEMARRLRESGFKMPIISISGDTSEAAAAECFNAGMNGRINKPFKPDDIYKMIEMNMK